MLRVNSWFWLVLLALLRPSFACPAIAQSQTSSGQQSLTTRYSITSHYGYETGDSYSSQTGCNWEVGAPEPGKSWRVTFDRIELEVSSSAQRCKYDNLTVKYVFNNQSLTRVLCGIHNGLVLVTDRGFSLMFQTNSSVNMRGFMIHFEAISRSEGNRMIAASQISPIFLNNGNANSCDRRKISGTPKLFLGRWYNTSIIYMSTIDGTYIHNADCSWTLPAQNQPLSPGMGLYVKFEQVQLEGRQGACVLGNLTVTYQMHHSTAKRVFCQLNDSVTLVTRHNVLLELRTDSTIGTGLNVTWFVAPYTGTMSGPRTTRQEFLQGWKASHSHQQCLPFIPTSSGGTIPLYIYTPLFIEPGMICTWNIEIPPGKLAEFRFRHFGRGRSRYRTSQDYLDFTQSIRCSPIDDMVVINFRRFSASSRQELLRLCTMSVVGNGDVIATAVGSATVTFVSRLLQIPHLRSLRLGLDIVFKNIRPTVPSTCPKVRRLDNYRRVVALRPGEQPFLYGITECSWRLAPRDQQHFMALKLSMDYQNSYGRYPSRLTNPNWFGPDYGRRSIAYPECQRKAIIASYSKVDLTDLFESVSTSVSHFRRTFCSSPSEIDSLLFSGNANLTIQTSLSDLILSGFNLTVLDLPKPRQGCSTVNISTKYSIDKAFKIFHIKAKAGCVVAESIQMKGFYNAFSSTLLKATFYLSCKNQRNTSLEIISQQIIDSVPCGGTKVIYGSWNYPLLLKFPEETDAQLISNVTYNFPVFQALCQELNSRNNLSDNSVGYLNLPLFISPGRLPITRSHYLQLACQFELPYRPGFSLLLRISHNLNYEDIDFYCHSKLSSRGISPHIVFTAKQRDPDSSEAWIEQQREMCHGYSVGTLSTKSELLVDGSVTVSLLSVQQSWNGLNNSGSLQMFNQTRTNDLSFMISYEYVPSCPELRCRSLDPAQSNCGKASPSNLQLTAELAKTPTSDCKWNIPINSEMRDAMARQSDHWLARVELSNFAFGCPCHDCRTELQHMTIAHKPADDSPSSDRLIICGDYRTESKVVHLALTPSQPDIQISFSALETGINVSVTFIDCRRNSSLRQCQVASSQFWGIKQVPLSGRTPGGLVFLAVLLSLMLIGCLLYINRAIVSSRLQAALEHQRLTRNDDTLQLTLDSAE